MEEKKSLKKTVLMTAVIIIVLLAIGLYFQLSYNIIPTKERVVYIMPTNCPEQICNVDSLRTWVSDIGVDLGIYNSNYFAIPSALVFKSGEAIVVNTISKKAFTDDLCILLNVSNACKTFESIIQKSDVVNVNSFTSLLSVNDIRLRLIAINLKLALKDKVDIIPRFIIVSNLDDSGSVNVAEVEEAARQLCILQTQSSNWVQYSTCIDGSLLNNQWVQTTWQACAQSANVDVNNMNSCVATNGIQLLKNEQNNVRQLKLTTSPVLFINNDVYTSRFTFDAIKKTVCMYFSKKPEGC